VKTYGNKLISGYSMLMTSTGHEVFALSTQHNKVFSTSPLLKFSFLYFSVMLDFPSSANLNTSGHNASHTPHPMQSSLFMYTFVFVHQKVFMTYVIFKLHAQKYRLCPLEIKGVLTEWPIARLKLR